MGMFDYYRPKEELVCSVCAASNLEWQGKDGPCELFVWEEGESAPVDQAVDDECRVALADRGKLRLPVRFEIYGVCRCPTSLRAVGFTEHGVWKRTELLSPANAVAYPHESDSEFRQRLAALAKHPGHAG
jgi:hypothetical protein